MRLTAILALWLGLNPDLHFLTVIPTNGVREEESAGLAKADSSAKRQASELQAWCQLYCDVARSLTLPPIALLWF